MVTGIMDNKAREEVVEHPCQALYFHADHPSFDPHSVALWPSSRSASAVSQSPVMLGHLQRVRYLKGMLCACGHAEPADSASNHFVKAGASF